MLECRVDQIRGKDVQLGITVRNRFNWTVKSVQTFSKHGYKNDATITQVVYEREDEFPFKTELEPLEEVANGLKYPNPKPPLRRFTAMIVLAVIFGVLWFMYPTLLAIPFLSFLAGLAFIPLVLLGITAIFGALALVFLISGIVRSVINSKSMKKRKTILEAARRVQKGLPMEFQFKAKKHKKSDEPVAPKVVPVPVVAPAPVVHPVVQPAPVPTQPIVHPVVQPIPQPVPHPVQPAPQPMPHPVQPGPQPVVQPAPRPVQPVPQPIPQPVPHPVQPGPQPVVQPAPRPVQPAPQPAPRPVQPTPVQPVPAQPVQPAPRPVTPAPQPVVQPAPQPAPAKPIEPTVVEPIDPTAK